MLLYECRHGKLVSSQGAINYMLCAIFQFNKFKDTMVLYEYKYGRLIRYQSAIDYVMCHILCARDIVMISCFCVMDMRESFQDYS